MSKPKKNPKRARRVLTKRQREAREDRLDIAAAKRGLRHLRKHGGYIMYDARQIANW